MKCDMCKDREAAIHIQQIIGEETIDLHLCEQCAHEKGISSSNDKIELSLSELLTGLIGSRDAKSEDAEKKCNTCGLLFRDFRREGFLGCPECYQSFREELVSLLRKMGGSPRHTGKIPNKLNRYKTYLFDRELLKKELEDAVREEEYEHAALLRDRIRELDDDSGESDG